MESIQKLLSVVIVLGIVLFVIHLCSVIFGGNDTKEQVERCAYYYVSDLVSKEMPSKDYSKVIDIDEINKGKIGWGVKGSVTISENEGERAVHDFVILIKYDKKSKEHYVETGFINGLD